MWLANRNIALMLRGRPDGGASNSCARGLGGLPDVGHREQLHGRPDGRTTNIAPRPHAAKGVGIPCLQEQDTSPNRTCPRQACLVMGLLATHLSRSAPSNNPAFCYRIAGLTRASSLAYNALAKNRLFGEWGLVPAHRRLPDRGPSTGFEINRCARTGLGLSMHGSVPSYQGDAQP